MTEKSQRTKRDRKEIRRWKRRPWKSLLGRVDYQRGQIFYKPTGDQKMDLRTLAHEAAHLISGVGHNCLEFHGVFNALMIALDEKPLQQGDYAAELIIGEAKSHLDNPEIWEWAELILQELKD